MNRMVSFYSSPNPEVEKEKQQEMLSVAIQKGFEAIINQYAKPEIITAEHIKLAVKSTEASALRKLVRKAKTEVLEKFGDSPDAGIAAQLIKDELQARQEKARREQTTKFSPSGVVEGMSQVFR